MFNVCISAENGPTENNVANGIDQDPVYGRLYCMHFICVCIFMMVIIEFRNCIRSFSNENDTLGDRGTHTRIHLYEFRKSH